MRDRELQYVGLMAVFVAICQLVLTQLAVCMHLMGVCHRTESLLASNTSYGQDIMCIALVPLLY